MTLYWLAILISSINQAFVSPFPYLPLHSPRTYEVPAEPGQWASIFFSQWPTKYLQKTCCWVQLKVLLLVSKLLHKLRPGYVKECASYIVLHIHYGKGSVAELGRGQGARILFLVWNCWVDSWQPDFGQSVVHFLRKEVKLIISPLGYLDLQLMFKMQMHTAYCHVTMVF